jgi:hypothetical protein
MVPDEQLPFGDPRRDSRVIKTLLHLFFPLAIYHIYVDGNLDLLRHPIDIVSQYLIQRGTVDFPDFLLALPLHQNRRSTEEELEKVSHDNLDAHRVLYHQMETYHLTNDAPMQPLFQVPSSSGC